MDTNKEYIAFGGSRRIAAGPLGQVVAAVKQALDGGLDASIQIFDAVSSQPLDLDLRGPADEVLARIPSARARPVGRPKLGVVAREVTLLPRHWDWLSAQPGGASVALRKLVEQASRENQHADMVRMARESAYRFMQALAGDAPNYEEALRALYAGDRERFVALVEGWPEDVRGHLMVLAAPSFALEGE